jgi:dihydroorotase
MSNARTLELRRPDDWHLHLRDGAAMRAVLPHTAARFARALVMPNLSPPVTTTAAAAAYRERILAALPAGARFEPLMALYLTDATPPAEIRAAKASGIVLAAKLYPAGATTHSDAGVTHIEKTWPALEAMVEHDMPLCVHGEVTDPAVDFFDREAVFIDRVLEPLRARLPALRVVFEHITTAAAVQYVQTAASGLAATITPHHLLLDRNQLFAGGLRPHHYCLPVLKTARDREALLAAATGGDARFFLGTDSAPHARAAKESACASAGIYSAHAAIELYAEAFESARALERLDDFAGGFGADWYRLPRNADTIPLERDAWLVPESFAFGGDALVPWRAGEAVQWRIAS